MNTTNETTTTTVIDRQFLKLARPRIDEALADLGKELGVKFHTGNASFDANGTHATFKLDVATLSEHGIAADPEAEAFKSYAALIGMSPDDLGKQIVLRDRVFIIAGYLVKGRKNNILIKDEGGRRFKIADEDVKRALSKANAQGLN